MVKICKPAPRKLFGLILFALIIVVADRLVKDLVLANIDLHAKIDLIPGVFRLTYTQNTGGAFSAFSGASWLFHIIVPLAVIFLVATMLFRIFTGPCAVLSCTAVIGGAIGNYIDRVAYGYVVDMFDFYLIDFAVFNLADCFITVGCILLMVCVLFFPEDKKEKKACGN